MVITQVGLKLAEAQEQVQNQLPDSINLTWEVK